MATTLDTIIQRVRRQVGDWPVQTVTTASLSSIATTVTHSGALTFYANQRIEMGYETMRVIAITNSVSFTVTRNDMGSSGANASYASGATIYVQPRFATVQIFDLVNEAIDNLWPLYYREVIDTTTIVPDSVTYEFTVPTQSDLGSLSFHRIYAIEMKDSGLPDYQKVRAWQLKRAPTPKIKFVIPPYTGTTVRVRGYVPFPHLTFVATQTLDATLPYNADAVITSYVVSELLSMGEALRVRVDTNVLDERESANRPGSSLNSSLNWRQKYEVKRREMAMPPMLLPHITVLR